MTIFPRLTRGAQLEQQFLRGLFSCPWSELSRLYWREALGVLRCPYVWLVYPVWATGLTVHDNVLEHYGLGALPSTHQIGTHFSHYIDQLLFVHRFLVPAIVGAALLGFGMIQSKGARTVSLLSETPVTPVSVLGKLTAAWVGTGLVLWLPLPLALHGYAVEFGHEWPSITAQLGLALGFAVAVSGPMLLFPVWTRVPMRGRAGACAQLVLVMILLLWRTPAGDYFQPDWLFTLDAALQWALDAFLGVYPYWQWETWWTLAWFLLSTLHPVYLAMADDASRKV